MPRFAWLVALISVAGLAACQNAETGPDAQVAAVGDAETGREAAMDWCGGCHAIGPGEMPAGDIPSFAMLLELRTPEAIRHYMTWERHPAMPALALEAQDIEDLVAYFSYLDSQ